MKMIDSLMVSLWVVEAAFINTEPYCYSLTSFVTENIVS